jgi:hypothetical protein
MNAKERSKSKLPKRLRECRVSRNLGIINHKGKLESVLTSVKIDVDLLSYFFGYQTDFRRVICKLMNNQIDSKDYIHRNRGNNGQKSSSKLSSLVDHKMKRPGDGILEVEINDRSFLLRTCLWGC